MACRVKELVSLLLYKICNPERSDSKIEEHVEQVDDLKAEAELNNSLKAISEVEELEAVADVNRLGTILENNTGSSEDEEEKKDEMLNGALFLPSDLVLLILSRLSFKDNIRSSAVCKTWADIAASVRVRDRPCWLMYHDPFHSKGVFYGFFDPIAKKKTKAMNPPELSKSSRIVCSKDGWLLMGDSASLVNFYFFNPFTRERIDLPRHAKMLTEYAFSCAPTKKSCLVFGINNSFSIRTVRISTWSPGATTWVDEDFPNLFPSFFKHRGNILYSDGLFYMASKTALGVFDPSARTWNVHPVQPIPRPSPEARPRIRWITEYKGQIFLIDASSLEPMVFRLNRLLSVWEKKETLDGTTIFLSDASSVMASGLTGSMSNIVYIWNRYINGPFKWNRPYKYSLYSRSLCEDPEGYYFEYHTWAQMVGVWIEPPQDISIFDYSILDPSEAINTELSI